MNISLPKLSINLLYCAGLISEKTNKNISGISIQSTYNREYISNILKNNTNIKEDLYGIAYNYALKESKNDWIQLFDSSIINKPYSKDIQGCSNTYDPKNGTYGNALTTLVSCISNGYITLPVDHKMCFSKKNIDLDYKPKNELARIIAIEAKKKLDFIKSIVGDAHFYSKESIVFYNNNNINFDFRIHSNRRIILENGKETSIKEHFTNKFKGSKIRKNRSVVCYIKGIKTFKVCIMRIFRSKKDYLEPIYIISNYSFNDISPHIKAIKIRWRIEECFRTCKQSLGISKNQSRSINTQTNHIYSVLLNYSLLEIQRKKKKLKNPEALIKRLKYKNINYILNELCSIYRNFDIKLI